MKGTYVYDFEVFLGFHCATFKHKDTKEIHQFVIHRSRNDFTEYIKFLQNEVGGLIGFNNINYDYPILHLILTELAISPIFHNNTKILTQMIFNKSSELINNEDVFKGIPEWQWIIPQLDLYKINHFDNKAKRTSLKDVEIEINFPNVVSCPYDEFHVVSDKEIQEILDYNLNDVEATYEFYLLMKDDIQMRKDFSKEYGINLMNANDTKIGSEIFAKILSEDGNIPIRELKQMRTYRKGIRLYDCILPYIKFQSKEFNQLLSKYKELVINETKDAIEENVKYKEFRYDFGLGGLHGCIKSGVYKSTDNVVIHDIDVASFYPNLAINNKFKPQHLGESFVTIYNKLYNERKSAPKGSAKNGGLKLALNSAFGKSNDIYSFFYDPMFTMQITVNGQLLLSMLAEQLVDRIECTMIQANTDGITLMYDKKYTEEVNSIMQWWQNLTGLQLESDFYNFMVIRDVNNYLARNTNNKPKYKGVFEIVPMANGKVVYWKDSSMKIVPIAISNYFLKGISIKDTIYNHTNIYDFCKRFKATSGWIAQSKKIDYNDNIPYLRIDKEQKNTRYYISNRGSVLIKKNIEDNREISVEANQNIIVFNKFIEKPIDEYDVNYKYYIHECNKIINEIEDKQLSLWN